jgi:hypothetical protein
MLTGGHHVCATHSESTSHAPGCTGSCWEPSSDWCTWIPRGKSHSSDRSQGGREVERTRVTEWSGGLDSAAEGGKLC